MDGPTPRSARVVEEVVNALARRQHGVVTRVQLLEAGLSAGMVRHRIESGRLLRLHQGVYRVGPLPVAWQRESAAVLACGADALLSHSSALALLLADPDGTAGLDSARPGAGAPRRAKGGADDSPVDVTVGPGGRTPRGGIRMHRVRELPAGDRSERNGIPVTTPIRTLVDVAAVIGEVELERAAARLLRAGLIAPAVLERRLAGCRGRPGMPALRAVLGRSGGPALTRSEAEVAALKLIRVAGLPAPQTNAAMGPYELDFYWPRERLAVEIDGFRHHSSRPRFEGDRRKDAWLRARGITVLRLTWRQVTEEAVATAVQLGQALVHAAR
jgi:very-short-patch-repair endonuclease